MTIKANYKYFDPASETFVRDVCAHYSEDILPGMLSKEQYIKKLNDTFDLRRELPEAYDRVTRERTFFAHSTKSFEDFWIIEENERSAFFYKMFQQSTFGCNSLISIAYTNQLPAQDDRFVSSCMELSLFLRVYRGIDVRDLENRSMRGGRYIHDLQHLHQLLTKRYGLGAVIELTPVDLDHRCYFLEKEIFR